tara:strand:+ start:9232 stop:9951 length:720 start_codon:yes stop_codon:yes gene_type:complete
MCFDAKTSLLTFFVSVTTAIYLFYQSFKAKTKNSKFFSVVIILIGLMQLLEFFIWRNQTCDNTNHNLSLLILVLITLQPIVGLNYYNYLYKSFNQHYVTMYSIIYGLFTTYILKHLKKIKQCSRPTKESCRLHWDSFKKFVTLFSKQSCWLFFILYFGPQLLMGFDLIKNKTNTVMKYPIRHFFLPVTFLATLFYVCYERNLFKKMVLDPSIYLEHTDAWGSMWCFMAAFLGIISILKI